MRCGYTVTIYQCRVWKMMRYVFSHNVYTCYSILYWENVKLILGKLVFQCYEDMRKTLEKCDIIADNNCFVEMKRTGSTPPGRHLSCNLPDFDLNMFHVGNFNIISQLLLKCYFWKQVIHCEPLKHEMYIQCIKQISMLLPQLQLNTKITTRGTLQLTGTAVLASSGESWKGQNYTAESTINKWIMTDDYYVILMRLFIFMSAFPDL